MILTPSMVGAAIPLHSNNPNWQNPATSLTFLDSKIEAAEATGCDGFIMWIAENEDDSGPFAWKLRPEAWHQWSALKECCLGRQITAHIALREPDQSWIWPNTERGEELIEEMRSFQFYTGCKWFTVDATGGDSAPHGFIGAWIESSIHHGLRLGPEPAIFTGGHANVPQMTRCQRALSMQHQQGGIMGGSNLAPQIILVREPRPNDPDKWNRWPTVYEIVAWMENGCLIAAQGTVGQPSGYAFTICTEAKAAFAAAGGSQ